jgi:hypothetical protein
VLALILRVMEIQFTTRIFKEGRAYVAHAMELDVSSCGGGKERALKNLKEAVRLFLEGSREDGYFGTGPGRIGLRQAQSKGRQTEVISVGRVTLPLPLTLAKA